MHRTTARSTAAAVVPAAAALLLLADAARAQSLETVLVTDTSADAVFRCVDLDGNGDFNGQDEITVFYDDQSGPFPLTNNAAMVRLPDGSYLVSDTTEDVLLRLRDLDGDGDALDAGEATLFYDGTGASASGVELTSARGMFADGDGVVWVASANTGGGGVDAIVRLEDLDGDGDASDAGEAVEFYTPAPGGSVGDSIPSAVARIGDGAVYYVETGSTGVLPKGVYRLEDLDGSGVIDGNNEVSLFFEPPGLGGSPFHWDLATDAQGRFYLNDTGNDVLWRFSDVDGDGAVDPQTEADLVYQAPGSSLIWESAVAPDGSLYVAEDQSPDRLLRLVDLDGDGLFSGPGEEQTIFDETVALGPTLIASPKGVVFEGGDGTIGASECGPAALNSTGSPASITAAGSVSVAADDVTLTATDVPPLQFGLFLASMDAGTGMPAGSQGVLCLGSPIGRYPVTAASLAGEMTQTVDVSAIPQPNVLVAAAAGETWRFQAWFRDANPSPTSNFTDAVAITFLP